MYTELPYLDFLEISRKLEEHNSLFYVLWSFGKISLTDKIDTACVSFDNEGNKIDFQFNHLFWNELSERKRLFIICHEMLHILFNHGKRMIGTNPETNNIAMDISINELLFRSFSFNKKEIENYKEMCLVETIFKNKENIKKNKNFEYYYSLIENNKEENNIEDFNTIDNHTNNILDIEEIINDLNKKLDNDLTEDEKNEWNEIFQNENTKIEENSDSDNRIKFKLKNNKIKNNKKWETIISKWVQKKIELEFKDNENWIFKNKNHNLINSNLSLPSENNFDNYNYKKNKINIVFFLDVSGSCHHLLDKIIQIAISIPKSKFQVKFHTFDTIVSEEINIYKTKNIDIGIGNESMDIIELFLLNKYKLKYPDKVFIITDAITPRFTLNTLNTKKWCFFLTSKNTHYQKYIKESIPKNSEVYYLEDFN